MTPTDISNAIAVALQQGGEQFVVSTIAAFIPALWAMALIFHLSRPYVVRTIRKLSLRFGADVWWLSYVLMRDGVIMVTFVLGLIFLMPNLMMNMDLPLTAPLSTLFLFFALYVKLTRDSDEDFNAFRLVTIFMVIGATFYFVPQTLAIEGGSQSYLAGAVSALDSTTNQALTGPILAVSLIGFAAVAGLIFYHVVIAASRRVAREAKQREALPAAEAVR